MREEKQLLLDEIRAKVAGSKGYLFTRYQKMGPNTASDFRLQLAKGGAGFLVVPKRLLMKAVAAEGTEVDRSMLQGHIGLVYASDDLIQTTKTVFRFSKENEEIFEVLGGHLEGRLYPAQDIKALSELPSRDEMRAQLLGLFEAPMAQTLSVMEAIMTSLLYCLENKCEKEKV